MTPQEKAELLRLVELDYDRTTKLVEATTGAGVAVRGWAVTIWLAVLAAAFDRRVWEIGVLGAVAVVAFGLADGYHMWLSGEALDHAKAVEKVTGRHYAAIARGSVLPGALRREEEALLAHEFGAYRTLKRFRLRDALYVRPPVFFRVIYPVMAGVSIASAIIVR